MVSRTKPSHLIKTKNKLFIITRQNQGLINFDSMVCLTEDGANLARDRRFNSRNIFVVTVTFPKYLNLLVFSTNYVK